jgi:bisphosphoglycerate-independent phosphoglycerate mutase (AlkP superfamily)
LTEEDYMAGRAISPDWTGEGWRNFLGFPEAPLYTPYEAGRRLAQLSREADFTLFSTWITDEIGHRGTVEQGVEFMQKTDQALQGLLEEWRDEDGLVVITSDHGNLELMSRRKHTANLIPTVAIGGGREVFAQDFYSLADITPGIMRVLGLTPPPR